VHARGERVRWEGRRAARDLEARAYVVAWFCGSRVCIYRWRDGAARWGPGM